MASETTGDRAAEHDLRDGAATRKDMGVDGSMALPTIAARVFGKRITRYAGLVDRQSKSTRRVLATREQSCTMGEVMAGLSAIDADYPAQIECRA